MEPVPCPALRFGTFELDLRTGELRKGGLRIKVPEQSIQVLTALVLHHGELVTREELKAKLWPDDTVVEFDTSISHAVWRLRQVLGDTAQTPRFIETFPKKGYRFIYPPWTEKGTAYSISLQQKQPQTPECEEADAKAVEHPGKPPEPAAPVSAPTEPEISHETLPRERGLSTRWWLALSAVCLLSFAAGWQLHRAPPASPVWKLTRITAEAGLADAPAISPDGKFVAYSFARSEDGARDLYIKRVAGGQPIRLTNDGADNTTPDFSPDGNTIVFRSNRNGGGIFETPAFGGATRMLARDAWNPKFSPDGSQIAYWTGARSVAASVPGSGAVWIVPERGGPPQRVGPNFTAARDPIWSPDGKHLLVVGYTGAKAFDTSSIDWWVVPTNGDAGVKTGAYDALVRAGLTRIQPSFTPSPSVPQPGCWSAAANKVVFSRVSGDAQNIWQIAVSPRTGKVTGTLERLTTGSGNEVDPTCGAAGALAFTSVDVRKNVWLLPFDLDRGTPRGQLQLMTQGPAGRVNPSLSKDGHSIAFLSNQSGPGNIWIRELATGKEQSVASSLLTQGFPVSNATGTRIAFSVYEKDKRVVYVSAPGGTPDKLCEGCLRATDWSHDEKMLLVFGGDPYHISLLDLASRQQTPLFRHPAYKLLYGRFSPDNRWVSFTARIDPSRGRITIAPINGPKPVPESAWVTIEDTAADDFADWSPDGKTVYFSSGRDGYSCLWGQRLHPNSRRPVGEPFAVQHLHGLLTFEHEGWSAAGGQIGIALAERTGNVWMMSTSSAR